MNRTVSLIMAILLSCTLTWAQKGLAIQQAFDELAVRDNATEVVMSQGRLKDFRLSFFHSLEVKAPTDAERHCMERCLQADATKALQREEGQTHQFYEMPQQKGLHRYILYRRSDKAVTLIYLEGKATLRQIKTFFQKNK